MLLCLVVEDDGYGLQELHAVIFCVTVEKGEERKCNEAISLVGVFLAIYRLLLSLSLDLKE